MEKHLATGDASFWPSGHAAQQQPWPRVMVGDAGCHGQSLVHQKQVIFCCLWTFHNQTLEDSTVEDGTNYF